MKVKTGVVPRSERTRVPASNIRQKFNDEVAKESSRGLDLKKSEEILWNSK